MDIVNKTIIQIFKRTVVHLIAGIRKQKWLLYMFKCNQPKLFIEPEAIPSFYLCPRINFSKQ